MEEIGPGTCFERHVLSKQAVATRMDEYVVERGLDPLETVVHG